MTSLKAHTLGLRSWPEIHHSWHLTLCGSWLWWTIEVTRSTA
jgi:hypothetical protein